MILVEFMGAVLVGYLIGVAMGCEVSGNTVIPVSIRLIFSLLLGLWVGYLSKKYDR